MSHILTVTRPENWIPDQEDNDYELEMSCDGVNCDLWSECVDRVHLLKDDDRYDSEVFEHGEEHQMLEGGYCVRIPGCAYQENGMESDSVWEIAESHGVGSYAVGLDWYDWGYATIYVEETLSE